MLWAVLCAPAAAAQVRLDDSCRAPGEATRVLGTGFAAGSAFGTLLDDRPLGIGVVDELGSMSASFPAPAGEGSYTVRVSDLLGNRGQATLTVRRASLRLSPTPANANADLARFVISGLGSDGASVWAHWIAPGGRNVANVRLGTAQGPCGELTTRRRRVLPRDPRPGRWRLQIDTSMRYDRAATPRVVQHVRVSAR